MGVSVESHPLQDEHVSYDDSGQGTSSSRIYRIIGVQSGEGRDHLMLRDYGNPAVTTGWVRADTLRLRMMTTCGCGDVVRRRASGQCDTCDAIDEM